MSLQNEDGAELAWTSGASCGGPALGVFTSPSLTKPATQVVVDVPAETQTALVVYASDSQERVTVREDERISLRCSSSAQLGPRALEGSLSFGARLRLQRGCHAWNTS